MHLPKLATVGTLDLPRLVKGQRCSHSDTKELTQILLALESRTDWNSIGNFVPNYSHGSSKSVARGHNLEFQSARRSQTL
jgi:hypothetical protein